MLRSPSRRGTLEGIKGQEGRYPSSQPGGERGVEIGYGRKGGGGPQKLRQQQHLGTHALGWGSSSCSLWEVCLLVQDVATRCHMIHKESAGVRRDSGHPATHRAAPQIHV